LKLGQWETVEYRTFIETRAAALFDPVGDEIKLTSAMGVGIDGNLHSGLKSEASVSRRQVKSLWA
jgi:hypothetical protein